MNILIKLWKSEYNLLRRALVKLTKKLCRRFGMFSIHCTSQNMLINNLGFDRSVGLAKLDSILIDEFGSPYDERNGMFSEHLILLAAISAKKERLNRILEIGTFDGRTALLLSKLFPEAQIVTIDLPIGDCAFEESYDRKGSVEKFIYSRDELLNREDRINFIELNSIALAELSEEFDLIWIDGAHGYPIVSMDVINAYRLVKKGGYVLIDDIWESVNYSDHMYNSIGGYASLRALVEAKLIESFNLVPKRLGGEFNYPGVKKFVGFFKKPFEF